MYKNKFNFKKYLKNLIHERYTGDQDPGALNLGTQEELRGINDEIEAEKAGPYEAFVSYLKSNVDDPKVHALLYSGLFDGNPNDDIVTVDETEIAVTSLVPTQKEIGLADSLGWVSKNNPTGGAELAAAESGYVADVGGRIITADGRYIIDGHHRWSQVYLLNPQAKIPAYNLIAPDSPIPGKSATSEGQDFLKMAQIAIAAVDGTVPKVEADTATDIYRTGGNREKITEIIKKVIPEGSAFATELSEKLSTAGKISTALQTSLDAGQTIDQKMSAALNEMKIYDVLFEDYREEMLDMADRIKSHGEPKKVLGNMQSDSEDVEYERGNYENVINYIVNNAISLYNGTSEEAASMTARSEMPQFDKGGSSPETKIKALTTGKIDWNAPYDEGDIESSNQKKLDENKVRRIIRKMIRRNLYR